MSNSTSSGTEAPVVQSVASASHPMVSPSLLTSSPALMASDPSIRAGRRNSKVIQILLVLLAVVALGCLLAAIFIAISTMDKNRALAQEEEARAREVKHVVAQAVRGSDGETDEDAMSGEDARIYLNISSIPAGADVYLDGLFIGRTDEEKALEKRVTKGEERSHIVVALNGYYVARKTFSRENDFSETITLEEIPVVQVVEKEKKAQGDVVVNKAKVVGSTATHKPKKSGQKGSQKPVAEESDIILPD